MENPHLCHLEQSYNAPSSSYHMSPSGQHLRSESGFATLAYIAFLKTWGYVFFIVIEIALVHLCCITKHPKTWWPEIITIYYFSRFYGFAKKFCWSHLSSLMQQHWADGFSAAPPCGPSSWASLLCPVHKCFSRLFLHHLADGLHRSHGQALS